MFLKEIDLSKAIEYKHPDIIEWTSYLVKIKGEFFAGRFGKEYQGLYFTGYHGKYYQFKAPNFKDSDWEKIWEIIENDQR